MNANAPSVAPDVQGLVAAEVERQVKALREEMDAKIAEVRERTVDDAATIVVFSGDLDKVLAGFVIATGAAAAGLETSMFFTFWGLSVLKKKGAAGGPKNLLERMFAMMTPVELGVARHLEDELLRPGRGDAAEDDEGQADREPRGADRAWPARWTSR